MKPKILIIDDVAMMRNTLKVLLKRNEYTVLEARDGVEGLRIAKEELPDLIITDLMMPKMDGFTFLKLSKLDKRIKDVPKLVLTALNEKKEVVNALRLGAIDYIVKPYNPDEIIRKIRILLEDIINTEN